MANVGILYDNGPAIADYAGGIRRHIQIASPEKYKYGFWVPNFAVDEVPGKLGFCEPVLGSLCISHGLGSGRSDTGRSGGRISRGSGADGESESCYVRPADRFAVCQHPADRAAAEEKIRR